MAIERRSFRVLIAFLHIQQILRDGALLLLWYTPHAALRYIFGWWYEASYWGRRYRFIDFGCRKRVTIQLRFIYRANITGLALAARQACRCPDGRRAFKSPIVLLPILFAPSFLPFFILPHHALRALSAWVPSASPFRYFHFQVSFFKAALVAHYACARCHFMSQHFARWDSADDTYIKPMSIYLICFLRFIM